MYILRITKEKSLRLTSENLKKFRYDAINDEFVNLRRQRYYYVEKCECCGEPFLACKYARKYPGLFCSIPCANKKKIFSAHHNQAISKAMSGKNHPLYGTRRSATTKKKIGDANRGNFHTEETKQRISEAEKGSKNHFYGKHFSEKAKKVLSEKACKRFEDPTNHPNWQGGISSEPYCFIWISPEWRKIIYERDAEKFCWNPECWGTSTRQTLHHIDYIKKNCDPNNIITLCNSCNVRANYNRDKWKVLFTEVMNGRNL